MTTNILMSIIWNSNLIASKIYIYIDLNTVFLNLTWIQTFDFFQWQSLFLILHTEITNWFEHVNTKIILKLTFKIKTKGAENVYLL